MVHVSEDLRDKLADTKRAWDKCLEQESQEREQEAPTLHKLFEDRVEMLSTAFRTGIEALREEDKSLMGPLMEKVEEIAAIVVLVADSAQVAVEQVAESQQRNPSEWSDLLILDSEELQELRARVEALEASGPTALASQTKTPADELYAGLA